MRVLAETMARCTEGFCLALILTAMMVTVTLTGIDFTPEDETIVTHIETNESVNGRQVEADCSGYSFEDMFFYNYAEFDIEINQNWDGGYVRAMAMVNGSDAGVLRESLDGLFEGLPGGDNDWLSTDEKDGVEAIGQDCVEQTYTRIGFRGGPSHRGGQGVDWNNATWIKEGMTLEETNLIPEGHPDRRTCRDQYGGPSGSPTCEEVPAFPTNAGQCGPNSCDTIIYLNSSVAFDQIIDPSDFTLGMVGRNLTNAVFTFIFPDQANPLRVANSYDMQDCSTTYTEDDPEADDYGVTYTTRNECLTFTTEDDFEYSLTAMGGTTSFSHTFDYDLADWPANREYFIDFTTSPPEVDNPPVWSDDAPAEGELIPVAGDGEDEYIVDIADINSWFNDDLGAGMLDVTCSGAAGWELQEAEANHWKVKSPSEGATTTVECNAADASAQETGARTFSVAPIMTVAVAEASVLDEFTFTLTPLADAPASMEVIVTIEQNGREVPGMTTMASSAVEVGLSVSTFSPGEVSMTVQASGVGMAQYTHTYNLDLEKQSIPPTIDVLGGEWVGANYILNGVFSDSDGEAVSFTLFLDGVQQGQVSVTGNQWVTDEIPFDLLIEGIHNVTIEACDSSGECTSVSEDVDNTFLFEDPTDEPHVNTPAVEEESGLPAPGIALTLLGLLGAGIALRRRD